MNNRKFVTRVTALVLVMLLALSFTASFAAGFSKSGAGITKGGVKLGATGNWKSKLSSLKRSKEPGCVGVYAGYIYKASGLKIETHQKKKTSSEEIVYILVTSKSYRTIGGLKVGDTVEKMQSIYGKGRKSGSTYSYSSGSYKMKVSTSSGKVKSIAFKK